VGVAASYQPMDAAACSGPSDCWFGWETLPAGVNSGAFHLHWNGESLTPLPSLTTPEPQVEDLPRPVRAIAFYKGRLYESVQIDSETPVEGENAAQPYLIHRIVEGSSRPFVPMIVEGPPGEAFDHEVDEPPFQFGVDASGLWAAGGAKVLRLNATGQFQQLKLSDPGGVLAEARIGGIAPEPGSGHAWVSVDKQETEAVTRVARIGGEGAVEAQAQLPEAGEQLARKGSAEAIACPAAGDCWVASAQGWLFHLGGSHSEDQDPYFHSLITYRPPDASVPFLAPETYPEDDSGSNPPPIPAPPTPPVHEAEPMVHAPLFSHVSERLVDRTRLALTFTLVVRSRVRLLARRGHRTVARTAGRPLARGRHTLKLRLDRRAWPTKLDLQVHALGPVPLIPAGSAGGGNEAIGGPTSLET
jgi:hypothetical protein